MRCVAIPGLWDNSQKRQPYCTRFNNPAIYNIAKSSGYAAVFHDISSGDNTSSDSPNSFYAVAGYDLCTGWGTPAGQALIDALTGPHDPLAVSPTSGLTISGALGGPFTPNHGVITLSNNSSVPIPWSLTSTSAWLEVTPASGIVGANSNATISVRVTSAAALLTEGKVVNNLVVLNQLSNVSMTEPVWLMVGQSIVENGGFETGDFTDWTLAGKNVVNSSASGPTVYNAVEGNSGGYNVAHSGQFGAFLGDTQLASLSQNVATIAGQTYLVSLWLNNPSAGTGQHFELDWVGVPGATNALLQLNEPGVLTWTNFQFLVTATQASSTLQLRAENDAAGFGLDDVVVKSLPVPSFQTMEMVAGNWALSWLAGTGIRYQVQHTSELASSNWFNLGDPIIGAGTTTTVTDTNSVSSDPARFYRLAVAP